MKDERPLSSVHRSVTNALFILAVISFCGDMTNTVDYYSYFGYLLFIVTVMSTVISTSPSSPSTPVLAKIRY